MSTLTRYTQLRNMDIESARKAIIQNLVSQWKSIDGKIKELESELKRYEGDLQKAKSDGDTSENSAYDTAINNISTTQGRIFETQKLQRELSLISEPEFVRLTNMEGYDDIITMLNNVREDSLISELTFRHFNGDLEKIKSASRSDMLDLFRKIDLLIANQGDVYEYSLSEQEIYEVLKDVVKLQKPRPYAPCGKVVMYSVVRVDVNGEEYVVMVCPAGVSYVTEGIIAANSELGKRLLNSTVKGTTQTVREGLKYTIKEIY